MEDLFQKRNISPMLLYQTKPFDSNEYIFELKLDGARCIAYLDGQRTDLRNKRNKDINLNYPELKDIYKNVKKPCIFDGEIIVMKNGRPNFQALQKRALQTNLLKINLSSETIPANYVVYDILQIEDKILVDLTLMERKKILEENLIENERISYSRYIENEGLKFFSLVEDKGLEGIIAKRKDSKYYLGKRSKVWLKIKVMYEEDVIICGYIDVPNGGIDLILGNYDELNHLKFIGTVYGIARTDREIIIGFAKQNLSKKLFEIDKRKEIIWMKPELKARIKFMEKTDKGKMRQCIYLGIIE